MLAQIRQDHGEQTGESTEKRNNVNKISVVMTTYNGERFLWEQLSSILSQTRSPDEVIIFDDCSTDHTVDILLNFIRDNDLHNWLVHNNQKNLGYLKNFRKAMEKSTGEIIFLCDQDDIWEPEKIEMMAAVMEENASIQAVACNYRLIGGDRTLQESTARKYYTPPERKTADLSLVKSGKTLYYNIAQGCASAYRRELVDIYCAVEGCWILPHDWALNLLAYQRQGLYYLNRELLLYRIHDKNQMGIVNAKQTVYNRIPRLEKYAKMMEDAVNLPVPETIKEELKALVRFTELRICWLQEKRLSIWIYGFFRHFTIVRKYFFFPFIKDLLLVFLRKNTNDQNE